MEWTPLETTFSFLLSLRVSHLDVVLTRLFLRHVRYRRTNPFNTRSGLRSADSTLRRSTNIVT